MNVLAPLHPLIVHGPLALLVLSLAFELIGRATDAGWWRKAALAMLLIGAAGAIMAVLSGGEAEHVMKQHQRVSHDAVEAHEDMGKLTMWIALAAVAARLLSVGMKQGRGLIAGLALLLHVGAAVCVIVTGLRGGRLVYDHGAGVKVDGSYVSPRPAGEPPPERPR